MALSPARRRIRHAGYAALAFAAFQLFALPMPLHRAADGVAWVTEWTTIAQVSASLVVAVLAIRGNALVAAILGVYGAFRIILFALAVVRVLDGSAARAGLGPAWVIGVALVLPFALFWVRGGLATLAVLREPGESPAAAI